MRRVLLMCLAAVVLTAGVATANTVWNPDPNEIVDGASNWDIAANWTNGLPGDIDQKPVFNVPAAVECQVTTNTLLFTSNLVMGDGSGSPDMVLRVKDGGTINSGTVWCGLGYNADGGTLIVEEGGTVYFNNHLWFGMNDGGIGRLVLDGGFVDVVDAIDLGRSAGGLGFVTINEGMLRLRYYPDDYDNVGSLCDIRYGTLAIENNYATAPSRLWSRINAGTIVAFGGEGTLNVVRENVNGTDLTLVTATHPMNPSPAYDELVAVSDVPAEALVDLSWTNMEPNNPGDPVYVDVWFGTDPNKLNPLVYELKVPAGLNTTTVTVPAPVVAPAPTTYYWQVDSYIYGAAHINEPNMIEGDVFKFHVKDDLPPTVEIVDPNVPTVTWVNQAVPLTATVSDTGTSAVSVVWSASDPNAVFTNVAYTYPTATADVSVDYAAGDVTVTVTVSDAANPGVENSDSLLLNVAADECAAALVAGADYPMDLTGDCVIDIDDLGVLAVQWLDDYALTTPIEIVEQP